MFGSTCTLLENLIENGLNYNICGETKGPYKKMKTFEFVFILLLMHRVLEIFDMLCQALQMKAQDILNVMNLVPTTKLVFSKDVRR